MFGPELIKHVHAKYRTNYLLMCVRSDRKWYLADVGAEPLTTRSWINTPKQAIWFRSRDDAEKIADYVRLDEYKIVKFVGSR